MIEFILTWKENFDFILERKFIKKNEFLSEKFSLQYGFIRIDKGKYVD